MYERIYREKRASFFKSRIEDSKRVFLNVFSVIVNLMKGKQLLL